MKSNVSHILILERERSSSNHQRELFSDEKTKKKEQQQQQLVVHSLSSFSSCAFLSLFFFRDVSTLAFLHFFNPRNEERFRQSLSLDTRMQSIQSTVVVEVRFKFSLSFKLSFKTLFFYLFRRKRFVLSLAPFFPLPLPSSFGKSRSVMMITFLDIFLDRLPGKRFVVLLFTLISLFSLSYARIPASNACE